MPYYQGDWTHYSHPGVFPDGWHGTQARAVPARGGRNTLCRIRMTRNPAAERLQHRVKLTCEMNKHTPRLPRLLTATVHSHCSWLSSLETRRDPISLCRVGATQSPLEGQSHPCWVPTDTLTESSGCLMWTPLLWLKCNSRREDQHHGRQWENSGQLRGLWVCLANKWGLQSWACDSLWGVISVHMILQ